MSELESQVASYVLAYLLRQNYAQTASAFLQECTVLPSRTLLVLPETQLQTIIAEHKTRKDTASFPVSTPTIYHMEYILSLLLDTLGAGSAWGALWEKLEQTLQQLRCLQEELLVSKGDKGTGGRRGPAQRASTFIKWTNAQPNIPTAPTPTSTFVPCPSHHGISVGQSSPQKRKKMQPRRKQLPDVQSSSTEVAMPAVPVPGVQVPPLDPPSGMPQVVEALLGDSSLPEKLADIINRCVTSSDGAVLGAELSSHTLETILDLTCAQPEIEGLLNPEHAEICPQTVPPARTSPQASPPLTRPIAQQDSTQASVQRRPVEIRVLPHQAPSASSGAQDCQPGEEGRPCKRPRLAGSNNPGDPGTAKDSFPAELDIEKFLEQLHS